MNSIQAIDYALTAIRSYSKRLSNAGSIQDANDAQDTLRALQDVLLEQDRAAWAKVERQP